MGNSWRNALPNCRKKNQPVQGMVPAFEQEPHRVLVTVESFSRPTHGRRKAFPTCGKIFLRQSTATLDQFRLQVPLLLKSKDNDFMTDQSGTPGANFKSAPFESSWILVQPNLPSFVKILAQTGNGREIESLLPQPFPITLEKADAFRPRRPAGQGEDRLFPGSNPQVHSAGPAGFSKNALDESRALLPIEQNSFNPLGHHCFLEEPKPPAARLDAMQTDEGQPPGQCQSFYRHPPIQTKPAQPNFHQSRRKTLLP